MRYIDATFRRMNRHYEGSPALLVTRAAMSVNSLLPCGQSMEAGIEDTEVLLTV
jgi:hypothetical protein